MKNIEVGGTFGGLTVGYYAILPAKVRHSKELSSSEKLLFAEVTALSQKWGYCTASNGFLGELLGVSNRTITRQLTNLRKLGFIRVELVRVGKEVEERRVYPLMDMYGKALSEREVDVIIHKFNGKGEYLGTSVGGGVDKNDSTPTDINVRTPHDKNVYTSTDINVQSINTRFINTSINNISNIVADKSDDAKGVEGGSQGEKESKPKATRYNFEEQDMVLAKLLLQYNQRDDDKAKANLESWANTARLMRERDERTFDEIKDVMTWAKNDEFWCANIMSMPKLRKQMTQLISKMKRGGRNGKSNKPDAHKRVEDLPSTFIF